MRVWYYVIASLLVATSMADAEFPLAFFANINGTMVALVGQTFGSVNILMYRNSPYEPTHFANHNGYVVTNDESRPGYFGIYYGLLSYGPDVARFQYRFNEERKLSKGPYFSCQFSDSKMRGIFFRETIYAVTNCFSVEIFLLPYEIIFNRLSDLVAVYDDKGSLVEAHLPYRPKRYANEAFSNARTLRRFLSRRPPTTDDGIMHYSGDTKWW